MRKLVRTRPTERSENGFTLIELMVVVLIISVLLAIAIPTFIAARQKAQDRAAQADGRNALTAAKTYYIDNQFYADSSVQPFIGIESSLKLVSTFSLTPTAHEVLVQVGNTTGTDQQAICLTVRSNSGKYFEVQDIAAGVNGGTYFATLASAPSTCDGTAKLGGGSGTW